MSTPRFLGTLVLVWSLAAAGLVLIAPSRQQVPPGTNVTDDALIYAAVLDSLADGGSMIVATVSVDDDEPATTDRDLPAYIPTRKPTTVLAPVRLDGRRPPLGGGGDYWENFAREFPDAAGWFDLSPITYGPGRRSAVVTYGHHCGWLCGSGGPVELERTADGWRVTSIAVAWIS